MNNKLSDNKEGIYMDFQEDIVIEDNSDIEEYNHKLEEDTLELDDLITIVQNGENNE